MTFPVTLTHPASKRIPPKTIQAKNQDTLDRLLSIGWVIPANTAKQGNEG